MRVLLLRDCMHESPNKLCCVCQRHGSAQLVSHTLSCDNQAVDMILFALQIAKLTQQVKTLERENGMLRQIIKNIQNPGDRSVPDAP